MEAYFGHFISKILFCLVRLTYSFWPGSFNIVSLSGSATLWSSESHSHNSSDGTKVEIDSVLELLTEKMGVPRGEVATAGIAIPAALHKVD